MAVPEYSPEPVDAAEFTQAQDRAYARFARLYDVAVKVFPVWKGLLRRALPHLRGPRVLEASVGTGYLLSRFAGDFEAHGIDYNERMVATAGRNARAAGVEAGLARASVEALPYRGHSFDSVVNTMAFSAYPDSRKALSEMLRVLKPEGRLVIIDVNYPGNGNWLGTKLTELWKRTGDLIRDMGALFRSFDLEYTDEEIGGWGSVHLYVASKGERG